MAKLKPWYKVVTPREDLREGKPLDAAEFAVHLDQVRDGRATEDYLNPERFFERTYLTKNLLGVASEAVRRLTGEKTETSAIFNMATQFGGGKTHALTLLYHLARHGNRSHSWLGVDSILDRAGITAIPEAATAVFVGTEFDSHRGRGGEDGTPHRKTPWGEIAYQLGGQAAFDVVAQHEESLEAPGGDVIRAILPEDQPAIILIDELMNYVNRNRKSGLAGQLYSFVQNLCSVARGSNRVVLVVSLPASVAHEMTADDEADFKRFKKILDREGKQVLISAGSETSEIIRRRLFEWDPRAVNREGRALLSRDAAAVCAEYARWTADNSNQIPMWFALDHASAAFEATYPFHPSVLSVFERKWQELPGFQRTRGILRLLALWVSRSYQHGYKDARAELLIGTGSAPLEDPMFRTAVFEQLGEQSLEGAVTTDICGKKESHAIRLDDEAVDTIRKARVHRRVATTIFFESNGGQIAKERMDATVPEIRLAVAGPELDLGNIETALDGLIDTCYYLSAEGNKYRFGTRENLNKRYADRRGNIRESDIDSLIREEIQQVFGKQDGVEPVFFPDESAQIADRPALRLVILGPEKSVQETVDLEDRIANLTQKVGGKGRTYKSGLIWVAAESSAHLEAEARRFLAWETIRDEGLELDEIQQKQLGASIKKARRDLRESVWRSYKNVYLLNKENKIARIDLGLVTSSAAESLTRFLVLRLREMGEIEKQVSPQFLVRNWLPSKVEWSTKEVRDVFFATPKFPRLQFPDTIRSTIARGVTEGVLGYVGKATTGEYDPFYFEQPLSDQDVEIAEDMYIVPADEARIHVEPSYLARLEIGPRTVQLKPGTKQTFRVSGFDQRGDAYSLSDINWAATGGMVSEKGVFTAEDAEGNFLVSARGGEVEATAKVAIAEEPIIVPPNSASLSWSGSLAPQKWTNFYMKVLSKLVSRGELDLHVRVAANFDDGVSDQLADEIRAALRSLDLQDDVQVD